MFAAGRQLHLLLLQHLLHLLHLLLLQHLLHILHLLHLLPLQHLLHLLPYLLHLGPLLRSASIAAAPILQSTPFRSIWLVALASSALAARLAAFPFFPLC